MLSKQEFLYKLRAALSGLPQKDIEERIAFYSEMIDDRMDECISEEEAVAQLGSVEDVAAQIIDDYPIGKLVKEKIVPKKKLPVWAIILIILGSPIWLAILTVLLAIFISVYLSIWAIIAALWAIDIAFVLCAVLGTIAGIYYTFSGRTVLGLLLIGSGLVLAGLTIFLFFGCKLSTMGAVFLTNKIAKWTKSLFLRKEAAQ